MKSTENSYRNIDEYISLFSDDVQSILKKIRKEIKKLAPEAEERISYQMPAFKLKGKYLVYFAAFKKHIGFYPTSSPISAFENELSSFKHAKGSIQFPINQPIPYDLIKKIIEYRIKELK